MWEDETETTEAVEEEISDETEEHETQDDARFAELTARVTALEERTESHRARLEILETVPEPPPAPIENDGTVAAESVETVVENTGTETVETVTTKRRFRRL